MVLEAREMCYNYFDLQKRRGRNPKEQATFIQ
jgi:hypothetical protein